MFAHNLKFLREKNSMEQIELANRLGRKSSSSVSEWEKGKYTPKIGVINDIAEIFNVSITDLMNKDLSVDNTTLLSLITDTTAKLEESRQSKVYNFVSHQLKEQEKYKNSNKVVSIEEFKTKEVELAGVVSAGGGAYNDKNSVETVEVESMPPRYDLAFQVSGDSMYPTFEDGEIIFIKETCDVYNGQIGVVEINKEAYVKKMYLEGEHLRLVSLNCDKKEDGSRLYPDFYADDHDDLFIVGRVII